MNNYETKKRSAQTKIYLEKQKHKGLPKIIEIAKYNNFGNRKSTDSKEIIGYFNFKSKFYLDGNLEHVRLTIRLQKDGKYYYNLEINKKGYIPKESL